MFSIVHHILITPTCYFIRRYQNWCGFGKEAHIGYFGQVLRRFEYGRAARSKQNRADTSRRCVYCCNWGILFLHIMYSYARGVCGGLHFRRL